MSGITADGNRPTPWYSDGDQLTLFTPARPESWQAQHRLISREGGLMDVRAAKREAYWRAACVVRDAMTHGWPEEHYPDRADLAAVSAALVVVIDELERKGPR